MTAPLKRVAVRSPGESMYNAEADLWNYGPDFNAQGVQQNHADFVDLLNAAGIEVLWMDQDDQGIADAVFTYDASLITPKGAVLMSPGKELRQGEEQVHRNFFDHQGIPVIGQIVNDARAEAGDTLWLDDHTLAIGRGFRTNTAGIIQIDKIMTEIGISTETFDMPCYTGKDACLHLMSLVSLVDTRKALVCKPLLPVALWQRMLQMGFELIEAPWDEFESTGTLSTNVLATSPGNCIMLNGIPKTRAALEQAGIKVQVFNGNSLCIGCEGGPTCMTRPILRTSD